MAQNTYNAARSWHNDVYASAIVSRNRWMLVAIAACVLMSIALLCVAMLVPLKEPVPYVISYNEGTGLIDVIKPLQEQSIKADEALTKYFLGKYVRLRETFDVSDLKTNYQQVLLMTDQPIVKDYEALYVPSNPQSLLKQYNEKTLRQIKIKGISFLNQQTASVRFVSTLKSSAQEQVDHWIAIISFKFTNEPKSDADRFDNPLGFQITKYRVDQEIVRE